LKRRIKTENKVSKIPSVSVYDATAVRSTVRVFSRRVLSGWATFYSVSTLGVASERRY